MGPIQVRMVGVVLVVLLALTSCGSKSQSPGRHGGTSPLFGGKRQLTIAVHTDEPGIGLFDSSTGERSGLDIGVANYITSKLNMTWVPLDVRSEDRERLLLEHHADLVIASFSMTDARIADGVGFVGPYLYTEQDMLVRAGDPIHSLKDLSGKTVCTAASSTALTHLDETSGVHFKIVSESGGYQLCVNRLLHHTADALVTDDAILEGYLHDPANAGKLRLVESDVGQGPERYGIGILATGHQREAAAIAKALSDMVTDGSWQRLVVSSFCPEATSDDHPCAVAREFLRKPVPQVRL